MQLSKTSPIVFSFIFSSSITHTISFSCAIVISSAFACAIPLIKYWLVLSSILHLYMIRDSLSSLFFLYIFPWGRKESFFKKYFSELGGLVPCCACGAYGAYPPSLVAAWRSGLRGQAASGGQQSGRQINNHKEQNVNKNKMEINCGTYHEHAK